MIRTTAPATLSPLYIDLGAALEKAVAKIPRKPQSRSSSPPPFALAFGPRRRGHTRGRLWHFTPLSITLRLPPRRPRPSNRRQMARVQIGRLGFPRRLEPSAEWATHHGDEETI